jgi:hypothetical protein
MVHVHNFTLFLIVVTALSSFMFLFTFRTNDSIMAATGDIKFSKSDFMIKDFGVDNDGNPFLTVEGNAGATVPQKENTGYAYVFVTNNGTFAVSSDWMYTKWHTHALKLDEKNCVESMDMNTLVGTDVSDVVKVTDANATKVDKVMTVEFTISNEDGSICATKIFDSAS